MKRVGTNLSDSDGSEAMVDSTRSETTLDDLESSAPSSDQVVLGDDDILVDDLAVSLGRIVVSKHRKRTDNRDSGVVGRDDDDGLPRVGGRVEGVRLSHHQVHRVTGITSSRDPPLVSVNHNVTLSIPLYPSLNVGGIGGSDEALGHGE